MNGKRLIDLWVEALESGAYRQVCGVMRADSEGEGPSYCCLGVVQEIALQHGADFDPVWGESNRLPRLVEVLLAEENPAFHGPLVQARLAEANDRGESFKRIAWRIRNSSFALNVDSSKVEGKEEEWSS